MKKNRKKQNAIILAAGFGLRMVPINTAVPKALLKVDGVPLIERLIQQLHEAGIREITIVVGYLQEQLAYLAEKYSIKLVSNPDYADKNNLHSLALVSDQISDTFILPCDIWASQNPFMETSDVSWYLMDDDTVQSIQEKHPYWKAMTGISYLTAEVSVQIRERLRILANNPSYDNSFWEEVLYTDNRFLLELKLSGTNNIYQINTFEDLRRLDSQSDNLKSETVDIICQTFGVTSEDISEIKALKKGMTNRSFLFTCQSQKYIMRIPGEGTDFLINRKEEAAVYQALRGTGISDKVLYMNPENGYKITEFLENSRTCDPENKEDLQACMMKLRKFHQLKLQVEHEFNLFTQLDFYESLRQGEPSRYDSYSDVKARVLALKDFIESQTSEKVLTHIDAVADNFLIVDASSQDDIFLIDWEYSGMQDPHVDLAMFSIYSYYTREQMDDLMSIYFEDVVPEKTRMKIYAYVAVCGLLWSNWCEYKSAIGVEFGDYADKQYAYAEEYSRIVLDFLSELP